MKKKLLLFFCLISFSMFAQTEVSGLIFDEYLEPLPGVTVKTNEGKTALSDFDGAFTIKIKNFPVVLTVTSVGYQAEVIELKDASQEINVILKESLTLDQVVLSASRTPERVMESPVTIERIGEKNIRTTASANYYDALANLKGIDALNSNLNITHITSNRGFANAQNSRFVQLVDGAETTVPVVDHSLGGTFGLNELDVKNVEILPGAASALYGANAFNGILLMTSKNPFEYQGASAYVKAGRTNQDAVGLNEFYDVGVRMAHAFNDSFAAKVNIVYKKGEDWYADDRRNSEGQGGNIIPGSSSDYDYDGVNVYGDEVGFNFRDLIRRAENQPGSPIPAGFWTTVEDVTIARRGYAEKDLMDYRVKYLTFDGSLYFRPWGKDAAEIILASKFSLNDNVLHAANRYSQKDGFMEQYKAELNGGNYFVRAYYTQNAPGETMDTRLAGISILNDWKKHEDYFGEYAQTYIFNRLLLGQTSVNAHTAARNQAESGRFVPGTPEFNASLAKVRNTNTNEVNGAKIVDNTGYYHVDANLNLADKLDFADIQFGGSFRSYALDSDGLIYTDDDGVIRYRQYGFYSQVQKKLNDDRLKITGTVRYDKSDNVDGKFSPRATISYAAGEKRDHNFRFAFQTAFRNPTTQDQYIGVNLGDRVFLGTVEKNLEREVTTTPFRSDPSRTATLTGVDAFTRSYTAPSVDVYLDQLRNGVNNPALLEVANIDFVKPETVQSFELGYRGAVEIANNLFEFDVVGHYNFHNDFITTKEVVTPFEGDLGTAQSIQSIIQSDALRYILRTNTNSEIEAYGVSLGFTTKVLGGFDFGANYAYADFKSDGKDEDFSPAFNTPKHNVKVQFGHDKLFKNFGFNIAGRWQDEFLYQSTFINGLVDERLVLDGQFNIRFPSIKSTFKFGGTNLTGKDYYSVPGTGKVGSQYYISWVINN